MPKFVNLRAIPIFSNFSFFFIFHLKLKKQKHEKHDIICLKHYSALSIFSLTIVFCAFTG